MTLTPAAFTPDIAARFADIALGHVTREYPHKADHVMDGPGDVYTPRAVHPVFYGSFDWHSCVHGYWLLATVRRHHPGLPQAARIAALFDQHLTADKVAAECAYLERPSSAGFERPYGWAWLLMLAAELHRDTSPEGQRWRAALAPLTAAFVARFTAFLPKLTYAIRAGVHSNTAFALALAAEYADTVGDADLRALLAARAHDWFGADTDAAAWEPSGDDFLSGTLVEALAMRRLSTPEDFTAWFTRFLPRLDQGRPASLLTPAHVSDRSDGKIAHLDGLNLSRAWCWRQLSASLPPNDPRRPLITAAAARHLDAAIPHVTGDYMGEHWLATFALLAFLA